MMINEQNMNTRAYWSYKMSFVYKGYKCRTSTLHPIVVETLFLRTNEGIVPNVPVGYYDSQCPMQVPSDIHSTETCGTHFIAIGIYIGGEHFV